VWNTVVNLSGELIHVVTGQPYRMPGKRRPTQDQRMYELVTAEGVESALEWFEKKGKRATWGGSLFTLANQLIQDGRVEDGLRLMEFDLELTPDKVWLLRKTAQAFLDHGRPEKAIDLASRGLELRPDDEVFRNIRLDADAAVRGNNPVTATPPPSQ
jgi:tetratricopeptide (TPR) repeat protein